MSTSDEHHLQSILASFEKEASDKYHKGMAEHGGHLWLKTGLIDQAIEETIDLVMYLYTLREQIKQVQAKFDEFKDATVDNSPID